MYADGWVLDSTTEGVYQRLTNMIPTAGLFGVGEYWAPGFLSGNYQNGGALSNSAASGVHDSYWLTEYAWLPPGASTDYTLNNNTPAGFTANIYELDYLTAPDGGSFQVLTNLNGGAFAASAFSSVNGRSAATNGAFLRWTNSAPGNVSIRVVSLSGTNRILDADCINSTITNGVILAVLGKQAVDYTLYTSIAASIQGPILASWNPDLILMPEWGASTHVPVLQQLNATIWKPYTPNAGLVVCGRPPASAAFPPANPLYRQVMEQACLSLGYGYFDPDTAFGSYAALSALGYAGDGIHMSAAGYAAYSGFLYDWLGLIDSAQFGNVNLANSTGTLPVSALPSSLTTNYAIPGGATLYITNGLIMRIQ